MDAFQEILEGQNNPKSGVAQRRNAWFTSYCEQFITYFFFLENCPERVTTLLNLTKWKHFLSLESHFKEHYICMHVCVWERDRQTDTETDSQGSLQVTNGDHHCDF